jgi:hypothetical protein
MRTLAILIYFLLAGCAYSVHQVHVADYDFKTKAPREISSAAEQFVVLGFTQNTDYVDLAWNQLKQKCDRGEISGVNTRFSTALGFFSWTNKVAMTAYCN